MRTLRHRRGVIRAALPSFLLLLLLFAGAASAELTPDWIASLPIGTSLSAGVSGMTVDAAGVTYVTGTTGSSGPTNVFTAAIAPDGAISWTATWNGPASGYDQGRGLALGPGGVLWVTGNTAGPGSYANVLLLAYDAATGALLDTVQHSSGPFTSEHGATVATDAAGNVYVGGGTVGDGGDALILKFDPAGQLVWSRVWDGPADAPFSQDSVLELLIDPAGRPVALIHGVMASLHPDYVVLVCSAASGATVWQATWGVNGGDSPRDIEMDANGDFIVTGTGLAAAGNRYGTIKLRGSDGQLLWQQYDGTGFENRPACLAIDGQGGVVITGTIDPDGDESNSNDNIYTVRRDAGTGALLWTHLYGANCIGCYDAAASVVADPAGNVFVAGTTISPPYSGDAITLVLDAITGLEIDRGIVAGASAPVLAYPRMQRFDPAFGILDGGQYYDANTGAIEIFVFRYAPLAGGLGAYRRGDANGDGGVNIADSIATLAALFATGAGLVCADAADANDDGNFDIADPIRTLEWLFGSATPLPAPSPGCGVDPTADLLDCATGTGCP